jgi:hypothetical protein
MSIQSLMVSKYHETFLKMPRERPIPPAAGRGVGAATTVSTSRRAAGLILRMVRLPPKVQIVALVGDSWPDA